METQIKFEILPQFSGFDYLIAVINKQDGTTQEN